MTKEEAKQILSIWLVSSKGAKGQRGYIEGWFDEEDAEAFHVAIEALSAEALLKQEIDFHKEVSRIEAEKVVDLEHRLADMVSVVQCKDCLYKQLMDEGDTKYYYCALEDRPNRNWSVDDTDFCSWGERREE